MTLFADRAVPVPTPARSYAAGSSERITTAAALAEVRAAAYDIPNLIGTQEVRTGRTQPVATPRNTPCNSGRCTTPRPRRSPTPSHRRPLRRPGGAG